MSILATAQLLPPQDNFTSDESNPFDVDTPPEFDVDDYITFSGNGDDSALAPHFLRLESLFGPDDRDDMTSSHATGTVRAAYSPPQDFSTFGCSGSIPTFDDFVMDSGVHSHTEKEVSGVDDDAIPTVPNQVSHHMSELVSNRHPEDASERAGGQLAATRDASPRRGRVDVSIAALIRNAYDSQSNDASTPTLPLIGAQEYDRNSGAGAKYLCDLDDWRDSSPNGLSLDVHLLANDDVEERILPSPSPSLQSRQLETERKRVSPADSHSCDETEPRKRQKAHGDANKPIIIELGPESSGLVAHSGTPKLANEQVIEHYETCKANYDQSMDILAAVDQAYKPTVERIGSAAKDIASLRRRLGRSQKPEDAKECLSRIENSLKSLVEEWTQRQSNIGEHYDELRALGAGLDEEWMETAAGMLAT